MPYEALPEVHWPGINITHFDDSDVLQDFEQLDIDLKQLMDWVKTQKTLWILENDKIQYNLSKIQASGSFLLKNWKWLGLARRHWCCSSGSFSMGHVQNERKNGKTCDPAASQNCQKTALTCNP